MAKQKINGDQLDARGGAWTSTTPTLTGLTIGNGTAVMRSRQVGKDIEFEFEIVFGSTTSFTGSVYVNFPVTAVTYLQYHRLGLSQVMSAPGGIIYNGSLGWDTTARMLVLTDSVNSTNVRSAGVASGSPIAAASGVQIMGHGFYEAA